MGGIYRINRSKHSVGRISQKVGEEGAWAGTGTWWLAGGINAANCIVAYEAKNAPSYAASKVNLANPGTYDATEGVAPDWDAVNGWMFNGTSAYLQTIVPAANYTYIVRFSNSADTSEAAFIGHYLSPDRRAQIGNRSSTQMIYSNAGYRLTSPRITSGVMAVAGIYCYRNGVYDGDTGTLFSGVATAPVLIGARNREDISDIDIYAQVYIQALAAYNAVLIEAQVQALTDAMNAL